MQETLPGLLRDRFGITALETIPSRHAPPGYKFDCPGAEAIDRWRKLRELFEESGYWPVILGNAKERDRVLGVVDSEDAEPLNKILYRLATETADGWLQDRRQANLKALQDAYGDKWEKAAAGVHGDWPKQVNALTQFTIPFEGPRNLPKATVTIGLFPVKHCWEVPAYLNFGGWNECPDPLGHALMMKDWLEKYGAEVVGMNGDVIEMYVHKPPSTREEALKVAEQQFLYCEDIVTQGTETIERLAAGLLNNHIWYFWWD